MTKEVAEKIVRGITDKIECNTADIDDWAEFWGFTREEYEEFLDMAIKALEQQPCEYKPLIIDKLKDEDMLKLLRTFQNQKVLVAEHDCLPSVTLLAEPCEDAISRQAVLEKAINVPIARVVTEDKVICRKVVFTDDIEQLPSVTPQSKTGRWMRWYEVIENADGKSTDHIPHCKCAECGTEYDPHSSQFIKYCHNCGAMMQEVENDGE